MVIKLKKLYREKQRTILLFMLVCLVFCISIIRIIFIQSDISESVVEQQSIRSILLDKTRGYIYDRNNIPLVNDIKIDKTIMISNSYTKPLINKLLTDGKLENKITDGVFLTVAESTNFTESDYIKNFYTVTRYSDNNLLRHIIGYTDSEGKGVCGIEKAFDKILYDAGGSLRAEFRMNSRGEALSLQGISMKYDNYDSPAGVSLTIDKSIQTICERILNESEIETGAVVVLDCNTSEIVACVSIPCYDIDNMEPSLNSPDKPFLNRAFNAYPVGSVIKPLIAAAAIKSGCNVYDIYDCRGTANINSTEFRCFNSNSHGKTDLNSAIEKSCNCYFIDLALKAGKENVISELTDFGIGKGIRFCSTLSSASGNLPDVKEITSEAHLANLSFGQGDLLVTPIQLAAAYSAIANGGIYNEPVLLKNLIDDNGEVYGYYKNEAGYRVIEQDNCEIIRTALYNNMLNGTGKSGQSSFVTSGGKTATAQTGRFNEDGNEILCTWFAGFFPYETPEYTVVIFNENGSTAALDCAPVFKRIIEEIIKL